MKDVRKGARQGAKRGVKPAAGSVAGLKSLQRGLTGERSLIGSSYMDDPAMLKAYLGYYWPVSRAQCLAALDRLSFLSAVRGNTLDGAESGAAPVSVIDVGSGPGPLAAAFASRGAGSITLLDQSRAALELAARKIAAQARDSGSVPPSIETVSCDIRAVDPARIPLWGEASCVSFGHCLNELWADQDDRVQLRSNLLSQYAQALAPGGFILVIEPALLQTSRDLLAVRNLLVERGWIVAAPCPGRESLPCPALAAGPSHTCHETVDWEIPAETARLARSMGLDRERLKMTWFALVPPLAREANSTERLIRVVSDPMRNKGNRIRRLVCGHGGRFPLSARAKDDDGDVTAYDAFDRLERGDIISVANAETRENGWGMNEITRIELLFHRARVNI